MLLVTSTLDRYAGDVARLLSENNPQEAARTAHRLSPQRCAHVIIEAPLPEVLTFLALLGWPRAGAVISHVPAPFAARIFAQMEQADELMAQFDDEFRAEIERFGSYEEDTAGAVMSP